jgi:AAA family ATPase
MSHPSLTYEPLTTRQAFAVGIIWPSDDVSQDSRCYLPSHGCSCCNLQSLNLLVLAAIQVSRSALLTARLADDAKANIVVLSEGGSSKSSLGLPRLKEIKEARTILLKEVSGSAPPLSVPPNAHESGKRRDWLALLLRESLGTSYVIRRTRSLLTTVSIQIGFQWT